MITIIVIVHNVVEAGPNILDITNRCITSLYETATKSFQLILVDNGSRDYPKTFDFLQTLIGGGCEHKQMPSYVKRNDTNNAISRCWNEVIAETNGEQIFLINNDISFHRKGWMDQVYTDLRGGSIGVVGLQGMSWNGFNFIEGSFFCFNRDIVAQLSGGTGKMFDEQFIFSCEDADVCRRIEGMGMRLFHDPLLDSYMRHEHHGTLGYVDREGSDIGGSNGRAIQYVTHDMRKLLCRKWGKPETIFD